MAVTNNNYTGNGTTTDFVFTFSYLNPAHIKAEVNGVTTTDFILVGASTVRFNSAPENGASVVIYRETPSDNLLADYTPGSTLRESDLELTLQQVLYVSQETQTFAANQSTAGLQEQINTANNNSSNAVVTANSALAAANSAVSTANAAAAEVANKPNFTQSGTGAVTRTVENKLRDIVSVKDFGAAGDGTTDDTAAIQAAITFCSNGKCLWFPTGTYKVTSTLTVTAGADISIQGEGRESTLIRMDSGSYTNNTLMIVGSASGVTYSFTMRDIQLRCTTGASGTAASPTPVVGLHMTRCSHAGVFNIYISGFYTNLRLQAVARSIFNSVFINTGGRLADNKSLYGVQMLSVNGGQFSCTGIHFTDMEIFSTGVTDSGYVACVYNEDVDGAYFNNCHFINGDRGYYAYASTNSVIGSVRFTNCYFDKYYTHAVEVGGNNTASNYVLNDHQFACCYFRGGQAGSVNHVAHTTTLVTRLLQFTNCVFATAEEQSIKTLTSSNNLRSLIVTGSLFRDCNSNSVGSGNFIQGEAKAVVISGNIFDGADSTYNVGSGVTNGYGIYISGNGLTYNVCGNHTTVKAAAATTTGRSASYLFVAAAAGASATNSGNIKTNNTWVEL